MEQSLDVMLFNKFKYVARQMRAGRAPGLIFPKCSATDNASFKADCPAFQREKILVIMLQKGGNIPQKELVHEMLVSPSTLSEMLNKLENDGYISRIADKNDRRSTLLTLTDSGKMRAEGINADVERFFAYIFRNLSNDEKQQMIYLLNKITSD